MPEVAKIKFQAAEYIEEDEILDISPMGGPLNDCLRHFQDRREKSKSIKRILKERLNIDCLRMLCPDEGNEDSQFPPRLESGGAAIGHQNNLHDSYHELMREIGVEQNDDEDISKAFLEKNGV